MSWWVSLNNPETGEWVTVEPFEEGGTYMVGGSGEADLNITYNYSQYYYQHLNAEDGLRWLNGKRAAEVTEALATAVEALGTTPSSDYWAKTPGNAGRALATLLGWARQYPDGVFRVN